MLVVAGKPCSRPSDVFDVTSPTRSHFTAAVKRVSAIFDISKKRNRDSCSLRRMETHRAYEHMMESMSQSFADIVTKKMSNLSEVAHQKHETSSHKLLARLEVFLHSNVFQSLVSLMIMCQGLLFGISVNVNARLACQEWDGRSQKAIEATQ